MNFFFAFLILVTQNAEALTETFLRMPRHQEYMNFVLGKYLAWHEKSFSSNFSKMNQKTSGLIVEALNKIDHWMVPGSMIYQQLLIGHSLQNNRLHLNFRLYLHQDLRRHPFLVKLNPPKEWTPLFIEWNSDSETCLLGNPGGKVSQDLFRLCLNRYSKLILTEKEHFSTELSTSWPNPFPYLTPWEIRRIQENKTVEIYYSTTSTHPSGIPRGLDKVIYLHSVEAQFPFDKYSVSKDGELTVYYP